MIDIWKIAENMFPWILVPIGILVLLKILEGWVKRRKRRNRGSLRPAQNASVQTAPDRRDMRDPKLQADAIARVDFVKTPLMNKGEYRVFSILERTCTQIGRGHRVMAQVNLGEFLKPAAQTEPTLAREAFASINSKRVDFLIIEKTGQAALAVEVQGSGHHLGKTAFLRDAVKKEAMRRAGISLLEVTPDMRPDEITTRMTRHLGTSANDPSYA